MSSAKSRPGHGEGLQGFVISAVRGIDSEETARKAEAALDTLRHAQADLKPWPVFVPPAPNKDAKESGPHSDIEPKPCDIRELLALDTEPFLHTAYLRVLGRNPDPDGLEHFSKGLNQGRTTKIQVLARLRLSPEGKAAGVPVPGLYLHLALDLVRQGFRKAGGLFGLGRN